MTQEVAPPQGLWPRCLPGYIWVDLVQFVPVDAYVVAVVVSRNANSKTRNTVVHYPRRISSCVLSTFAIRASICTTCPWQRGERNLDDTSAASQEMGALDELHLYTLTEWLIASSCAAMLSIRAAKLSTVSVAVGAAAATVASASCFRAAASVTLLSAIIAAATDATATDWAVTCSSSGLPLYEAPATRAIQPGWTGISL